MIMHINFDHACIGLYHAWYEIVDPHENTDIASILQIICAIITMYAYIYMHACGYKAHVWLTGHTYVGS